MVNKGLIPTDITANDHKAVDALCNVAHQILNLSNRGFLRIDFLRESSKIITDFVGCEAIEIWLKEHKRAYRVETIKQSDGTFEFEILPNIKGEGKEVIPFSKDSSDFEQFCTQLFSDIGRKQNMLSFPFSTAKGSCWTGQVKHPLYFNLKEAQNSNTYELNIEKDYKSLALVPIPAYAEDIGFLLLKSKQSNFFSSNQIEAYECIAQIFGDAVVNRRGQVDLRERVKEMTCLYSIARLVEQPDISLPALMKGIVETLPPAYLYPDIASARIVLDENAYLTKRFNDGHQKSAADIVVNGVKRGFVEVVYSKEMPELDEGPFLKEERDLIDAVAQELALIIERRQIVEDKTKLEEQLRHADRLATIGQLSAGVAHELNEPLSNILGFAQLASKASGLPKQAMDDIEKIINASLHSREVIKKLLFFARQMPIRKGPVNLNKVVEEGMYFLKSRCDKEGIDVTYLLASDLPEINADQAQLNQVLVNLVVNAIQSMPNGGTLTIKTSTSGKQLSLVVEDTGIGMNEDVMKKVFIPFFTTKDVGQGTGLGLSVVHGIVTSHSGTIKVESKPKQGSRFEIQLPVNKSNKTKTKN